MITFPYTELNPCIDKKNTAKKLRISFSNLSSNKDKKKILHTHLINRKKNKRIVVIDNTDAKIKLDDALEQCNGYLKKKEKKHLFKALKKNALFRIKRGFLNKQLKNHEKSLVEELIEKMKKNEYILN